MPKGVYQKKLRAIEERFLEKVDIRSPDDCWPWLGSENGKGYGELRLAGKKVYAHRLSYTLANPDVNIRKWFVLHECDNPCCCNPTHLKIGTQKDNMQDCVRRGRLVSRRKSNAT